MLPTARRRGWLSGAAGAGVRTGDFGRWRGSRVAITAIWADTWADQVTLSMLRPGGLYARWDADIDLAIGGIFKSHGQSWAAAARGAYDRRWVTAFCTLRDAWGDRRGTIHLRFAHEFNGNWMPWSVTRAEVPAFVATWRRVHGILAAILPDAHMVFSPNDGSSASLRLDWRTAFPGRSYVDEISVSSYNQYPYVDTATGFRHKTAIVDRYGAPVGLEQHRRFAQAKGVPFAVSEWASNASMGDGVAYMRLFRAWLRSHEGTGPGRVVYEIFYNVSSFHRAFQLYPVTRQPRAAAEYRRLF